MNDGLPAVLRAVCVLLFVVVVLVALVSFVRGGAAADPCAIPNFTGPTNFTSTNPNITGLRAIVVADFNKDGKPDLAAPNQLTSGRVSVFLGDGSGGFSGPTNFAGGRMPTSIAAGDFNGDGNADLVLGNDNSFQGEVSILLGNGTGGFGTQTFIRIVSPGDNRTSAVAIGDINSDGKADLVLTSKTFHGVMILIGNGGGQFSFFKSFASGGFSPTHSAMADLNGDGKLDLAVTNQAGINGSPGNVATLLGDGAGNFSSATTFPVGTIPGSIAVGDFNSDTQPDLAVTNSGSNNISILLGNGAGNFSAATNVDARASGPHSVVQADFNGDGKIDLAVFNGQPGSAVIFLGDGTGGFTPVANFPAGPLGEPQALRMGAVGDFNSDGRSDLAVATDFPAAVSVLLNACGSSAVALFALNRTSYSGSEGDGTFGTGSATFTVIRTGDITGVASVDYGTSNGTAIAPQDYTAVSGTLNFAAGETFKTVTIPLTNDNTNEGFEQFNVTLSNVTGNAELGNQRTSTIFIFDDDPVPSISINDVTIAEGDMGFTNANFLVSLSNPSSRIITVNFATAAGSATAGLDYQTTSGTLTFNPGEVIKNISVIVNGDAVPEVNETFFISLSAPANGTLADSEGLGTIADNDSACPAPSFAAPTEFTVGSNPIDLVVGDFNSDGKADLAIANTSSNNVSVLLGNGAGDFSAATNFSVGNRPVGIAAADLNLDGKLDVVTANNDLGASSISILLSNGPGTFAPASNQTPIANIRAIGIGDLNVDGKPDLVVVSSPPFIAASTVSILLGNGTGGFGAPTNYATGLSSHFVAVADVNGDSKLDLVTPNFQSHDVSILINTGDGTFASATSVPVGPSPNSVVTGDVNGDGKVDLLVPNHATTGNVSILLGNGLGGFSVGNSLTVGSRPYRLFAADLNGDSKLDLAVADPATSSNPPAGGVWVLFGNGMGSFTTPVQYAVGPERLAVVAGDFNADGDLDLATTNFNSTNKVSILINTCPGQRPTIFVEEGAVTRALALDSVTLVKGPFPILTNFNFSGDRHTRVILFTSDLGLTQPDSSKLTVRASGSSLLVENVGTVTGVSGLVASYIIVRLPEGLSSGDHFLTVTLNGLVSTNSPTLSISQ